MLDTITQSNQHGNSEEAAERGRAVLAIRFGRIVGYTDISSRFHETSGLPVIRPQHSGTS
jgi:hypothetical protein